MMTVLNIELADKMLASFFSVLVGKLYKILPMREENEDTLPCYLESLQFELLGLQELVPSFHSVAEYIEILAILQGLRQEDIDVQTVRREVFKAIPLSKRIAKRFEEVK